MISDDDGLMFNVQFEKDRAQAEDTKTVRVNDDGIHRRLRSRARD